MRSQIKQDGVVFPGSVALLNGTGSINVHQNMLHQSVYIPVDFIGKQSKFENDIPEKHEQAGSLNPVN